MCGIAGFWTKRASSEEPLEILKQMGNSIAHRGPDDSGYFFDPEAGLGFVHRRLSIIDLSPAGHQPMASASGRYLIIFNGEIYNFEEVRNALGERQWKGHSDTEVMLEAVERWGLDAAVQRFVGMFTFALWDRAERTLHLVRDRLGIKPLYYGQVAGSFVFASELKAIREFPGFTREVDRNALASFMRHGYIPSPHCIYRGIQKLQPGCVLLIGAAEGSPEIRRYWSAAGVAAKGTAEPVEGGETEMIEELHQKLLSAVGLRMIADVPLGAFLSGGIDSSLVVALMQAQSSRPVKTFTIGFDEAGYNEAAHAKKVAEHLKTEHTELYVTPQQALDVVRLLPSMYDEPFADSSQIPTYLVSKLARGSVTVSLSGEGGDELFGGYDRYPLTVRVWRLLNRISQHPRNMASGIVRTIPTAVFDGAYRSARALIPKGMRVTEVGDKVHRLAGLVRADSPESLYLALISQSDDPSTLVPSSREPNTVARVIRESAGMGIEGMMMLADLSTYLPDDILTKVDRASMAVSLEARVPILDHRVVEYAWRIPLNLKMQGRVSKWILRQILYKYVPQQLVERPKMGFTVPVKEWLRGPLCDWAEHLLSEKKLSEGGLLNAKSVRRKWQEHTSGRRNWQAVLWSVLVFQAWYASQRQPRRAL